MRNRTAGLVGIVLIVAASGCVNLGASDSDDDGPLLAESRVSTVEADSPGILKLNARNQFENTTFFSASVQPTGDYSNLVSVTDSQGEELGTFELGPAPPNGTTGEEFAYIRRDLNVTSLVELNVTLRTGDGSYVESELVEVNSVSG